LEIAVPENILTNHYHAAVWIDHHEARVFHFNATDVDEIVVHPEHPTRHIHHKANSIGSGHSSEDHAFFQDVIGAIGTASAILVTGPANAKTELIKHIHRHNPELIERIAAVETVDHPTDGAFVAHARRYFRAADRMSAQRP
jgi:stalled ribosome rescue protein Dom34